MNAEKDNKKPKKTPKLKKSTYDPTDRDESPFDMLQDRAMDRAKMNFGGRIIRKSIGGNY